ncbi:hypothetical protein FPV67DRAFT_1507686 [Lyophyllum atratum]|nr:hypothetical protein FPV67DRAFT_1507686 [Lyophyllum atratum]
MTPLLYLTALALNVLISARPAEAISLKSALAGKYHALVKWALPDFVSDPSDAHVNSTTAGDLELLDIVLVASVDGKFHGLNRTSGHLLWSTSSFSPPTSTVESVILTPLVHTTHIDYDPDETNPQELYVIEPQSGDIYVMATPTSPLIRYPYSMSDLVDMSPFSYDSTGGNRVFTGVKTKSFLLLDLETGEIKPTHAYHSKCVQEQNRDAWVGAVDLDDLDDCNPDPPRPSEVCFTRTDYNVSIYRGPYNRDSKPPVQDLSFSAYGIIDRDQRPQAAYRQTKDDTYIQSLPNGEILSFRATSRGETPGQCVSQLLWRYTFDAPIVTIFDVLTSQESRDDILVLLQPRPDLEDVLPDLNPDTRLPNRKSAFVVLFVMSPACFPHVVIGSPEPNDASTVAAADDLPPNVDSATKIRSYKEQMEAWERDQCLGSGMYTNRRCLIGIRPLEEGEGPEEAA